ncbi:chloroplast stem-loop binding protein of 41 kDa b, chloroplastic [Aplysia californica]|uniref:Chloroplast stem-loop binding protein of 41 kDa b, chloroplastic n=1 Tax=Aplysia californica TaxID=6500 RepID=A0ABM0K9J5_APLCA|nr:chloroplast stem-loop binding protein of 41 kDa b, chloroplastic [Aplysia californica]XP_005112151.1 chloroplast stem-loop binding protein of 41 kDa b, chloroplastic [Aplysia californica]
MGMYHNRSIWCTGGGVLCIASFLFGIFPSLPISVAKAVDVTFIPKNILIFGGNGFIGSSTAERLIAAGHKLTLVNRGNWYWDTGFYVQPHVQHIMCDRMQAASKCSGLVDFVYYSDKIDAVVDFSAYHPQSVADTLSALGGKVRLYIYISTDSVYEVSAKNHTEPSLESDAVRPSSEEKQKEFAAQESYGHRKLECEEILADYRQNKYGPPYVSLRLPDVFGQRDNTYRWWIYQLWMKLRPYLEKDIVVPSELEKKPISLVYVNDVADLITQLVEHVPPEAIDQAFNLALEETPSLMEILQDIRSELNLPDLKIVLDNKPDTIRLFPSVHQGPVDISKARKVLNWQPTEWKKAVKETVKFYESAIRTVHFDKARKEMIRTMQTYFTSKPYNVIRGLRDIYGLNYPEPRDEL